MERKTIKTDDLKNYKETIKELIYFHQRKPYKSMHWFLCEKLKKEYLSKDTIIFAKDNGSWVHYIGQLKFGKSHSNCDRVKITTYLLTLVNDDMVDWNYKEFWS